MDLAKATKTSVSVKTFHIWMLRLAQDEKSRQLSLGLGFAAAACTVLIALVLRLGYCCQWFGMHPKLA